jgi:hypothetical protein
LACVILINRRTTSVTDASHDCCHVTIGGRENSDVTKCQSPSGKKLSLWSRL